MALRDVRFEETVWVSATPLRRMEWRSAIEGVVAEGRFRAPHDDRYLLVTPAGDVITLEFLDEEGEVAVREEIRLALLADEIKEYVDVIGKMDSDASARDLAHLEALDMAKKVVHDKAARALAAAHPGLAADHATYRRIFTMLLSLHVDTTRMAHARGHRFVG